MHDHEQELRIETHDNAETFFTQVTGNELKILIGIHYLDQRGEPTSADAIARIAGIHRATVYRALVKLASMEHVLFKLSASGRACVDYAISATSQIMVSQIATPVNAQNATPVANRDNIHAQPPAEHVNRENKVSTCFASVDQRLARDLADRSMRTVNDTAGSLGWHIKLWQYALEFDARHGNHNATDTLKEVARSCGLHSKNNGNRCEGAQWTNRARAALTKLGVDLKATLRTTAAQRR